MAPPFDQRLANEAAAVDQCVKLGGVVLQRPEPTAGFAPWQPAPSPPADIPLGHGFAAGRGRLGPAPGRPES